MDNEPVKEGRRVMAVRSPWWQHYDKVKDKVGIVRSVRCKYCKTEIKAESKGHGTTSLKRHFHSCKHNPNKFINDPSQDTLQVTQREAPATWKFDADALREAFDEMIIEDEMPFAFGEKSGFRKFMSKACPRFNVPSRRTTT